MTLDRGRVLEAGALALVGAHLLGGGRSPIDRPPHLRGALVR